MTKPTLLYDSNVIYKLIKETPDTALDKLAEGSTIYLAYYELGNALWRESLLLKRISIAEAQESLALIYSMLEHLEVATLSGETGSEILETAHKFNLTFYDSAYLVEAKKSSRVLVTDDAKLAKTAKSMDVETTSSNTLINRQ